MSATSSQALAVVVGLVLVAATFWLWTWRGELRAIPQESAPRHKRGRRLLAGAAAAAATVSLAGCGAKPFGNGGVAQPSASPPAVREVVVHGRTFDVVGVFADPKARNQGLQHRNIGQLQAAVFTWDGSSSDEKFWMINTPQPLSLLWVAAGRVVGHVEMARCAMSCPTYAAPKSYDTAVEALAGSFAGVRPGEWVSFQ